MIFKDPIHKTKKKVEIGEGSKQKRKSKEDARPCKLMKINVRQPTVTSLGIVVCHIFSRPHKEYDFNAYY
jgi:hypothetical protein